MAENLFETQYDLTKKSKIKKFYESYKILIISFISILVVVFVSFNFYFEGKEKKKISLSENYLQAKIYLEKGDKNKAINTLKEIIFENDPTYSTLCLFLIMNQNLIADQKELSSIFDHIIENNQFSDEDKNLLIYKRALFSSSIFDENEMLELIRPLLKTESLWKPHALILLGDYFVSKKQYVKAIEFYQEIFTIGNLHQDLYNYTRVQLEIISHE